MKLANPWTEMLLVAALLASGLARADFKVCNKRSSTMYVAHSVFRPATNKVNTACGGRGRSGPGCYFEAWEVAGWYRADPGACVTTWIGDLPADQPVFVRAEFEDGAVLWDDARFYEIRYEHGFIWHEQTADHGEGCLGSVRQAAPCVDPQKRGFRMIDTRGHTSYTVNVN